MYHENLFPTPARLRRSRVRLFFLFSLSSLLVLLCSVPSRGQTMYSTDLPALWLRADSGAFAGGAWKDATGRK